MGRIIPAATAGILVCLACGAGAAERFFMYNLTATTVFTSVQMAPAGTQDWNTQGWGANQALNDKDKTVEASERVEIKNVTHGQYDVRLTDSHGRACIVRGVDLTKDTSFAVRDSDLVNCK